MLEARRREFEGLLDVVLAFHDVVIERTVHAFRAAGAALVQKQDVPVTAQRLERRGILRIELNGATARPTGKWHHRVRLGFEVERRHDGDGQLQLAGLRSGRIQRPWPAVVATSMRSE